MTGKPGRKNIDPTKNARFPIQKHNDLKDPIFFNGRIMLNSYYRNELAISVATSKAEPKVNRPPPAYGFMFFKVGQ